MSVAFAKNVVIRLLASKVEQANSYRVHPEPLYFQIGVPDLDLSIEAMNDAPKQGILYLEVNFLKFIIKG